MVSTAVDYSYIRLKADGQTLTQAVSAIGNKQYESLQRTYSV